MTKKRKRRLWYLAIFLGVLTGLGIGAKLYVNHIDAEAEKFAETGKAAIALLSDFQAGKPREPRPGLGAIVNGEQKPTGERRQPSGELFELFVLIVLLLSSASLAVSCLPRDFWASSYKCSSTFIVPSKPQFPPVRRVFSPIALS